MDEERIYLSMMGALVSPLPEVENAFSQGQLCEQLYQRIYDANLRLYDRLDVGEEDPDVETIVDCFFQMNHELCLRMYRIGLTHGAHSENRSNGTP